MRDTSRPLPFAPGGAGGLRPLARGDDVDAAARLLMGLLVALPVLFAIVYRVVLATQPQAELLPPGDLYAVVVALYWIRNVLPLAALFFATVARRRRGGGEDAHLPAHPPPHPPLDLRGQVRGLPRDRPSASPCPRRVLTFFILVERPRVLRRRPRGGRPPARPGRDGPRPRRLRGVLRAAGRAAEAAGDPRAPVPLRLGADGEPARVPAALHADRLAALAHPPPAGPGGPRRPLPAGAAVRARPSSSWSSSRRPSWPPPPGSFPPANTS